MNENRKKAVNQIATRIAWRIYGPGIIAFGLLGIGFIAIALFN